MVGSRDAGYQAAGLADEASVPASLLTRTSLRAVRVGKMEAYLVNLRSPKQQEETMAMSEKDQEELRALEQKYSRQPKKLRWS